MQLSTEIAPHQPKYQDLPSFLEETAPSVFGDPLLNTSATKAAGGARSVNLMGFPDLDMGDGHFQVSEQV